METKMKNTNKEILRKIKNTIIEIANELNIKVDKIILFGSRARGDAKEDSDWDILIVTKHRLNKKTKMKLIIIMHKELVKRFLEPFDIIVVGKEDKLNSQFFQTIFEEGVMI